MTKTNWTPSTTLPQIPKRSRRTFLITVEQGNGRRVVGTADFTNNYWLEWSDSCEPPEDEIDDEGGKHWSGWMVDALDYSGEELGMEFKGNVIAWAEFPKPFEG